MIRRQMTKDYVLHPLLSGPSAITTLTANLTANLVRNLWTHSVIMCGHFPEGVQTYEKESIDGVTRGDWCLRQMLGSANISGNRLLHLMTGNLLPDRTPFVPGPAEEPLPGDRAEGPTTLRALWPDLRQRPDVKQVGSAWKKVFRLSPPNDVLRKATAAVKPASLNQLIFGPAAQVDATAA